MLGDREGGATDTTSSEVARSVTSSSLVDEDASPPRLEGSLTQNQGLSGEGGDATEDESLSSLTLSMGSVEVQLSAT